MDDPSWASEGGISARRVTRLRRIRANRVVAGLLWRFQPLLLRPFRAVNAALRALNSASHHLQYRVEGFLRPSAEWFDHELDAQWQHRAASFTPAVG
jgi:hypothetical protein